MTNIPQDDPEQLVPRFCPRCGGQNLHLYVSDQLSETGKVLEPQSRQQLDEHQCADCDGASFWI